MQYTMFQYAFLRACEKPNDHRRAKRAVHRLMLVARKGAAKRKPITTADLLKAHRGMRQAVKQHTEEV
jgi:hypothetical protein